MVVTRLKVTSTEAAWALTRAVVTVAQPSAATATSATVRLVLDRTCEPMTTPGCSTCGLPTVRPHNRPRYG